MGISIYRAAIGRYWKYLENGVFIVALLALVYMTASHFSGEIWRSLNGQGIVGLLTVAIQEGNYTGLLNPIAVFAVSYFALLEISKLIVEGIRPQKSQLDATAPGSSTINRLSTLVQQLRTNYKANLVTGIINITLLAGLVAAYFQWVPYFLKFSLFNTGTQWYWWIYTLLVWELSYWVWHFTSHRVRLFWCFHSPHHTPVDMNVTVNFQIFFAEFYHAALIQLPILMLLGVDPAMVLAIRLFNDMWGLFLHAGERAFKNGRLGILQYFIITPSHHRVHHGKNPLYMDTNFCTMLQFWDWLFGTLQREREEVKIEYGVTRDMDVTSFVDVYFGECIALYNDVKNAIGIRNKLLYLCKPPGWRPESNHDTAVVIRGRFLRDHPELAAPVIQWNRLA
jgi:sterol desaturase/sphingolipid hydroxylase (fatty acid hydroxylase superfamily)